MADKSASGQPSGSGEDALRVWRSQYLGTGSGSSKGSWSPSVKGSNAWSKRKIKVKDR